MIYLYALIILSIILLIGIIIGCFLSFKKQSQSQTTQPQPPTTQPQPQTTQPQPQTTQPQKPTTQPQPPTTQPQPPTTQPQKPTTQPQPPTTQPQPLFKNEKLIENTLNISRILKNYLYSILCPEYKVSDSNHQCMVKLISENFSEEEIRSLDSIVNTLRGYNQNIFNILYKIAKLASKCLSYNWNDIPPNVLDLDCKLSFIDKNSCIRENFQKYSYMEFKVLIFFYSIHMRDISPEIVEFTKLITIKQ